MKRNMKITGAVGIAALVAAGGFAYTASNTVPDANLGFGQSTVSGATATALTFGLSSPDKTKVDSIHYVVSDLKDYTNRTAEVTVSNGTLTATYACDDVTLTTITCDTTSATGWPTTIPSQLPVTGVATVGLLVQ